MATLAGAALIVGLLSTQSVAVNQDDLPLPKSEAEAEWLTKDLIESYTNITDANVTCTEKVYTKTGEEYYTCDVDHPQVAQYGYEFVYMIFDKAK